MSLNIARHNRISVLTDSANQSVGLGSEGLEHNPRDGWGTSVYINMYRNTGYPSLIWQPLDPRTAGFSKFPDY